MNQHTDPSFPLDRKLTFIVNKLLDKYQFKDPYKLTDLVLERHREYQRKNRTALQTSIENILSQRLNGSAPSTPQNQIDPSLIKHKKTKNKLKRKHDFEDCSASQVLQQNSDINDSTDPPSDLEYDQLAQHDDLMREELVASPSFGGTSMLNAGLRSRYMIMQRERDMVDCQPSSTTEIAAPAADVVDANISAIIGNNPDSSVQSLPMTNSAAIAPKTLTQKTKKKRSSTRSDNPHSSSSLASSPSSSIFQPTPRPKERYSDLGGLTHILQQIRQLIEYPLMHPELFQHLGIDPPRGILLRGPPGTGKTHLANAIAGQLNVTFFRISSPELVGGISGESESRIRDLFTAASLAAPSIVFLDELDAIAPKRGDGSGTSGGGTGRGMEKRVVAQLLTSLDSLSPENNVNQAPVMVIGATNRPDAIDPALRRAGRFDREISLGVPDEEARECILRVMTTPRMRLSGDFDFKLLARKTPGFVGADIRSLTKEAAVLAINRIFKMMLMIDHPDQRIDTTSTASSDKIEILSETTHQHENSNGPDINTVQPFTQSELDPLYVTMADFLDAIPHVQPSSKREGFATIPDVSWDNIGALQSIREELVLSVLEPIQHPERFLALGIPLPAGVLLFGPP